MKVVKKLIVIACLTICLIKTLNAAETIGVIEDDFYKDVNTIVTIREVIPHNDSYMALVDGSSYARTQTTSVKPFFTKIWEHFDDRKVSKCKIEATIVCGTKTAKKTLVLDQEFPYHYLRDIEDKTSELILGTTVTYYQIKEFERADKSIFKEKGLALYMITLKEERISAPDVAVCFKEWVITSQWQRKTRHARRFYTAVDIYHTTIKRMCNITGADDEIINKEYMRKELTFKLIDPESPECGNNGGNLPNKAIILS